MCAANSKRQRYCWRLPFPVPEHRSTYFHTLSVVQWKWSLGSGFCFRRQSPGLCRIDGGRWDHKEQASDERTDNKSGSYSHPFCGDTKNPKKQWRMSPIGASDWSIQLHVAQSHRWISQMRHSYCRSLGLSIPLVLSRRVSSNYRPRSPRSWGFFHPIKFYYWDWQWPSRGHRVRHPVPI